MKWSMYGLCIEVRNIGLGTANNVSMKWSFPIAEVVKEVNKIAGTGRVLTYNRKSERLNVKLNEELVQSVGWRAHRRDAVDYIMPASIETTPTTLMVPAWQRQLDVVMRQTHRAGDKLFVDYAGQTVPVIDRATGAVREAQIFVAVLGASNYTYASLSERCLRYGVLTAERWKNCKGYRVFLRLN